MVEMNKILLLVLQRFFDLKGLVTTLQKAYPTYNPLKLRLLHSLEYFESSVKLFSSIANLE